MGKDGTIALDALPAVPRSPTRRSCDAPPGIVDVDIKIEIACIGHFVGDIDVKTCDYYYHYLQ